MYRGGQDPIEWMNRFADRVILLHQKDFPADAPQPLNLFDGVVSPTENIDMAVFEERKNTLLLHRDRHGRAADPGHPRRRRALPNLDYLILEQDHTALTELESIRRSHDAFASSFTGITWP